MGGHSSKSCIVNGQTGKRWCSDSKQDTVFVNPMWWDGSWSGRVEKDIMLSLLIAHSREPLPTDGNHSNGSYIYRLIFECVARTLTIFN